MYVMCQCVSLANTSTNTYVDPRRSDRESSVESSGESRHLTQSATLELFIDGRTGEYSKGIQCTSSQQTTQQSAVIDYSLKLWSVIGEVGLWFLGRKSFKTHEVGWVEY